MPDDNNQIGFRQQITERGTIAHVSVGARTASYLNSAALSQHLTFGPAVNPLDSALSAALDRIAELNRDGYGGAALDREIESQVSRLRPVFNSAVMACRDIRENLQVRRARALTVADANGATLRGDLRRWFESHELPQRIALAFDCDWNLGAAIIEAGQKWSGLDADLWERFEARFMALNHVKIAGLDASHVIASTTEFLTGAGTDHAAAMAAAESAVKAMHAEAELLDLAEGYLQAVLRALMLVSGKPATEITGLPA